MALLRPTPRWIVIAVPCILLLAVAGGVAWRKHEAALDQLHLQQIFLAENCPGMKWDPNRARDLVAACEARLKSKASGGQAAGPVKPTAAATGVEPSTSASAQAGPPPADDSPAGRARVAAGIRQLQQLVQQRMELGREPNAVCTAKLDARGAQIDAIESEMGGRELLARKTRFARRAPDLDQTIEMPLVACLMSCTDDDAPRNGSEDDDYGGPGGLRHVCQQAGIALADWSEDLKAGK
jgi:hypothetical protein